MSCNFASKITWHVPLQDRQLFPHQPLFKVSLEGGSFTQVLLYDAKCKRRALLPYAKHKLPDEGKTWPDHRNLSLHHLLTAKVLEHLYSLGPAVQSKVSLTHCRLNELSHTLYWKILISILGMSGYVRFSERKMVELFANSGDPDQRQHSAASDLGLHCLQNTLLGVSRLQWVKKLVSGQKLSTLDSRISSSQVFLLKKCE